MTPDSFVHMPQDLCHNLGLLVFRTFDPGNEFLPVGGPRWVFSYSSRAVLPAQEAIRRRACREAVLLSSDALVYCFTYRLPKARHGELEDICLLFVVRDEDDLRARLALHEVMTC